MQRIPIADRTHVRHLCSAAVILLTAVLFSVIAAPIKIMPLGDSRTAGPSSRDCYRLYLDRMMTAAGYSFDFVGTQKNHGGETTPPDSVFDIDHQGMWGWTTEFMLHNPSYPPATWDKENIANWTRATTPDIVLALLGTTDIHQDVLSGDAKYAQIVKGIEKVIDTLRSVKPSIAIILANLYPVADSAKNVEIAAFNPRIPEIVARKNSVASPVIFVDTWTGFDKKELVDWLHANGPGSIKIAQRWLGALWPFFDSIPPVSVRSRGIIPGPVTPLREGLLAPWVDAPTRVLFSLTGRAMPRPEGSTYAVGVVRGESYYLKTIITR